MLLDKRVLITVPHLKLPGGVTGLFNLLQLNKIHGIEYFSVNLTLKNKWNLVLLPFVYLKFMFRLPVFDVVHINPSLNSKSFLRDSILMFLSKSIFKKKVIVYWHGWEDEYFNAIKQKPSLTNLYRKTFAKADIQLVLASEFAQKLQSLGSDNEILVESNVTTKHEVSFNDEKLVDENHQFQLLFISRITKGKGWDIAIKTMKILQERGFGNVKLNIAGSGDALEQAKDLVLSLDLNNVSFSGHVSGDSKDALFRKSDILFFPTCYGEGMPITILEGMMFGLPIISRNVGGIPDHIENLKNGYLTNSEDPAYFAELIIGIIQNPTILRSFFETNVSKANIDFIPERLQQKLIGLYNN